MKKNALIVGGTSGLGLELAKLLRKEFSVFITGRRDPYERDLVFTRMHLTLRSWDDKLDELLNLVSGIDLFVYAAGYFQKGLISALFDKEIDDMLHVGLAVPAKILSKILKRQDFLRSFIAITSTSQLKPRLEEPVYTAAKAGLGMLANSISLDSRVAKTLVAAPTGMNTPFWSGTGRDTSALLGPRWVARQIVDLHNDEYEYKHELILREPPRVKIIERR